ncbi:aminoacyl-histidine dipeptidase [Blattamonas nauphoetae]|uniref:Aminoacyl-histidine dipeptidase n=1 Tax=Blattamonas nauphoetae TaxID=2049346 RepID=A0ABQ9YDD8_9EUKA|nr:aminoacyl-histidine dipeptidase [Blattamonas nauphoetae]
MTSIHPLMPSNLWKHFEMICSIPHGSFNTKEIIETIRQIGVKLNMETLVDDAGNVMIRKPAYPGRENVPSVCLQSHVDMVCEHDPKYPRNMSKVPIKPIVVEDGEFGPKLMAEHTTLGADDGIGVATALVILESTDIKHGPLEFLFTNDEEVGMKGARALKAGFLKSEFLVNLDSEEDWRITVGCAGAFNVTHTGEAEKGQISEGSEALKLSLSQFKSGHSGCDIHLGRANANSVLGRLLDSIVRAKIAFQLSDVNGGDKRNVIPSSATAVVVVKKEEAEKVKEVLEKEMSTIKSEYLQIDPSILLTVSPVSLPSFVTTPSAAVTITQSALTAPHGVLRSSPIDPSLVETSVNFFHFAVREGPDGKITTEYEFFARSLRDSQLELQISSLSSRAALLGLSTSDPLNFYNGWAPDLTTSLFKATKAAFEQAQKKEPEIYTVHAGLECGIMMGQFPNLKCVSLGPHVTSPHTIEESLHLKSVKPFFETVIGLLEMM